MTASRPWYSAIQRAAALTRRSVAILRARGWRRFFGRVRRKLLPSSNQVYAFEALDFAETLDFTPAELQRSAAAMAVHAGALPVQSVNWFLPHFDHAYYGGIYTILRFAASFAQRHGVRNTFVILGGAGLPAAAFYQERIAAAFPALAGSAAIGVRDDAELTSVPPADVCIATFWTTAYALLKFNQTKRKGYFLQDYEPMFYPAGAISAQVEATYRFGFVGLANTITLKQHYADDYQGEATFFNPCVDTSLFYPADDRSAARQTLPYTVFFYARPDYPRNGFELGAQALRQLKQRLGRSVRIVSAGQRWNPASYGLDGVVEPLGLLSLHETARLYRECDVGLAMMFTRHPSYLPFELMASGCAVVSNVNSATAWLLRDGENCLLALPSATCIADALARALADRELRQRLAANALRLIRERFADWDAQTEQIYRYLCDPRA
jgi:glycosyltransferase involved in cell wall biosynthesis